MEKTIGELFVIGFEGKSVPKAIKDLIHRHHIGGIILFARNIGTPNEVLSLTTSLQREAKAAGYKRPLFICIDQENGVVRRLGEGTTLFPGAMALGASNSPEKAYEIGFATGKELLALGINWNLAPDIDVNVNPDNPVIGVRSFGESPEAVARLGKAVMKGMQDAGVVTTLKHFPGHGDTKVDSHLALPTVPHDMKRLEEVELRPFRECINAGADVVMTAHIYFPAIETDKDKPATLSQRVITGLLRERLGFSGVVTTDCLEMNAISETIGTERGAVAALQAGVDIVMISHTLSRQINALDEVTRAIENGEIDSTAIDKAVRRVQVLKDTYLSWDDIDLSDNPQVPDIVGSDQHSQLALEVYRSCVTIVKNEGVLPLSNKNVLVLSPENRSNMQAEDKKYAAVRLGEAVREHCPTADEKQISEQLTGSEIEALLETLDRYEYIIIGTLNLAANPTQRILIEKIATMGIPIIAVAMRSPYDIAYLSAVQVSICTYDFSYPALQIAAGAIFGKEIVTGTLPVRIAVHD